MKHFQLRNTDLYVNTDKSAAGVGLQTNTEYSSAYQQALRLLLVQHESVQSNRKK